METINVMLFVIVFMAAFISVYLFIDAKKQQERIRRRRTIHDDTYARLMDSMERTNMMEYERYRPSRRPSRRPTIRRDDVFERYFADREQYHKEREALVKQQIAKAEKQEKLKRKKELEKQKILKEQQAYKKPGRSSRTEKAARIMDELENSKKRKAK